MLTKRPRSRPVRSGGSSASDASPASALVPVSGSKSAAMATLAAATERARQYLDQSKAANTLRAYAADWRDVEDWCTSVGRAALPATPETVALYISDLAASARVSTIRRRLTTIRKAHAVENLPDPTRHPLVHDVLDGIKRELGVLQRGKSPLLLRDLQRMIEGCDDAITGLRDRALLLLGFSGAFRRSELASLTLANLSFPDEGLVVFLARSKTDQEGQGVKKAIPYGARPSTCPVRAVRDWLDVLGVSSGPVFRRVYADGRIGTAALSDRSVALIVKKRALQAGLDPTRFAGHSLRSGFATQAAISGASERAILRQGNWASEKMARRYIRDANLFRDNAAGQIGL